MISSYISFIDFLYIAFFISTFYKMLSCSKSICAHILRYGFYVQLLTLNDSMSCYCFSHYFQDMYMITVFNQ